MRGNLIAACLAGLAPLISIYPEPALHSPAAAPLEWPGYFQEAPLTAAELSPVEQRFARNFPGAIRRFTFASGSLLARYVSSPTRKLHPSSDCFRSAGYEVSPQPPRLDRDGHRWGCFSARNKAQHLLVCERIYDLHGQEFSDVSSWYWSAVTAGSRGPWWAITVTQAI